MNEKNLKRLRVLVVIVPLFLFAISLTQIAFTNEANDGTAVNQSYLLLITGPFIIMGGATFEWLTWMANPLALYAIISFLTSTKTRKLDNTSIKPTYSGLKSSIIACIIAWQFGLWKEVMKSESGSMGDILSLNAGYWLWASSTLLLALGIGMYVMLSRKCLAKTTS